MCASAVCVCNRVYWLAETSQTRTEEARCAETRSETFARSKRSLGTGFGEGGEQTSRPTQAEAGQGSTGGCWGEGGHRRTQGGGRGTVVSGGSQHTRSHKAQAANGEQRT